MPDIYFVIAQFFEFRVKKKNYEFRAAFLKMVAKYSKQLARNSKCFFFTRNSLFKNKFAQGIQEINARILAIERRQAQTEEELEALREETQEDIKAVQEETRASKADLEARIAELESQVQRHEESIELMDQAYQDAMGNNFNILFNFFQII